MNRANSGFNDDFIVQNRSLRCTFLKYEIPENRLK
jgi:hypothetical protein